MYNQIAHKAVVVASAVAMIATGCSKGGGSYSLLNDASDYKQTVTVVSKPIDILWVIDNSGSMKTSQDNLAANFQAFIARFNQSNYDFHMAVTTTEAWQKKFELQNIGKSTYSTYSKYIDIAKLRDGVGSSHSGVFVMDKNTPNLSSVFVTNIKQGVNGSGDERAFESFRQALNETRSPNSDFRRADAFLAVVIVSDEEDFSLGATTPASNESFKMCDGTSDSSCNYYKNNPGSSPYNNPDLYSVQSYVDYLNTLTGSTNGKKNYSVSSIFVDSTSCRDTLDTDGFTRKISTRLPALSDLTGGVKASLCGDFGTTLSLISDSIINLSAVFKLTREPKPETIVVTVNGAVVPQDATNGWTYDATDWTVTFHGSSVPAANADIKINFDPKTIKL